MAFWVHGRDSVTGERDQFLSEAAGEDAARAEAAAQGMIVEKVEPAEESAAAQPRPFTPQADAASADRYCIKCGQRASQSEKYCSKCGVLLPDREQVAQSGPAPAGVWIRFCALFIDGVVLGLFSLPLSLVALSTRSLPLLIVASIPGFVYKPIMECHYGATLGKMACRLKVMDEKGQNLTLGAAYLRFLPFLLLQVVSLLGGIWVFSTPEFKTLSGVALFAALTNKNPLSPLEMLVHLLVLGDCLTVAFANRKRAVHDMMAGSLCLRKAG